METNYLDSYCAVCGSSRITDNDGGQIESFLRLSGIPVRPFIEKPVQTT